jgi:hypothetical protein
MIHPVYSNSFIVSCNISKRSSVLSCKFNYPSEVTQIILFQSNFQPWKVPDSLSNRPQVFWALTFFQTLWLKLCSNFCSPPTRAIYLTHYVLLDFIILNVYTEDYKLQSYSSIWFILHQPLCWVPHIGKHQSIMENVIWHQYKHQVTQLIKMMIRNIMY